MIYILAGLDTKKKNVYIKTLIKNRDFIVISLSDISKEILLNYASGTSLFGEPAIIGLENFISKGDIALSDEDLKILKDSPATFIFLEDKLIAVNERKYKKYTEIIKFEEKTVAKAPKINIFAIADAFGRQDKIGAWIMYREAIEAGIEPESISGILFWKIKTMLLGGVKVFSLDVLKRQSSEIVSLYHRAHRGEADFVVGLEQFILSSLSK